MQTRGILVLVLSLTFLAGGCGGDDKGKKSDKEKSSPTKSDGGKPAEQPSGGSGSR